MKTWIGDLQTLTTKAKNLNNVSLCHKTTRDFGFEIQSHIAQPSNSLEILLYLIFIIYMFPWWKFRPCFFPRVFSFLSPSCNNEMTLAQATKTCRSSILLQIL
jgi:hypothetical protein